MKHAMYCALCAVVTFLLLALSARYVADFWLFSFFYSFALHLGLVAIAGSGLALLLNRRIFAALLLVWAVAICGHGLVMRQEFLADADRPVPQDAPSFRLMSMNVLFENWKGTAAIADTILASGADVVYLLEARPMRQHLQRLKETYPYQAGCGIATDTCDVAILSKHPLSNINFMNLSDLRRHRFAVVDMLYAGSSVQLAVAHLTKPYYDDYHTEELERARKILVQSGRDFVIAGDFNSASVAPDMQQFLRSFNLRTGEREPATWPAFVGDFGIPIDHIYATPGFRVRNIKPVEPNGSNHRGLVADLVLLPRS